MKGCWVSANYFHSFFFFFPQQAVNTAHALCQHYERTQHMIIIHEQ